MRIGGNLHSRPLNLHPLAGWFLWHFSVASRFLHQSLYDRGALRVNRWSQAEQTGMSPQLRRVVGQSIYCWDRIRSNYCHWARQTGEAQQDSRRTTTDRSTIQIKFFRSSTGWLDLESKNETRIKVKWIRRKRLKDHVCPTHHCPAKCTDLALLRVSCKLQSPALLLSVHPTCDSVSIYDPKKQVHLFTREIVSSFFGDLLGTWGYWTHTDTGNRIVRWLVTLAHRTIVEGIRVAVHGHINPWISGQSHLLHSSIHVRS